MTDAAVITRGIPELIAGTLELAGRIRQRAPRDFAPVAEDARRQVAGRVPKRSGRMSSSVAARVAREAAEVLYTGAAVYAGWVDFGGGRYRGRPYAAAGRYLYPVALAPGVGRRLELAGAEGAAHEIGGMTWPRPTL